MHVYITWIYLDDSRHQCNELNFFFIIPARKFKIVFYAFIIYQQYLD